MRWHLGFIFIHSATFKCKIKQLHVQLNFALPLLLIKHFHYLELKAKETEVHAHNGVAEKSTNMRPCPQWIGILFVWKSFMFFFRRFFFRNVWLFFIHCSIVNWGYFWCLLVYCWINSQLLDVIIGVVLPSGCFFTENIGISRHNFWFWSFVLVISNFSVFVTTFCFSIKHKHSDRLVLMLEWDVSDGIALLRTS